MALPLVGAAPWASHHGAHVPSPRDKTSRANTLPE
jgi:hypothetical protein